ncbi:sulfhydryl oxidase 1 [Drosophila ficusphila]|uniref:sulfhydryl oxidase 1 n=1 Tax=Drosophila ficusphila TaxID=30025 RepID=UPI0007E76CD9|nr:sulfhydryl oxidase 1 [Drosophila ficusphila]
MSVEHQVILAISLLFVASASAGVPLPRYEALLKQQSAPVDASSGLYDDSDKVVRLTVDNFNATVVNQNRGALVEFYNTYCGHCRRFAPTYKTVAEHLLPWSEVLFVAAIDCAAEENNGICRNYEVMGYPTLRYLGPGFQPSEQHYGQNLMTQDMTEIRELLAGMVAAENLTSGHNNSYWPNFHYLTENDSVSGLFEGLSSARQYVAVVHEPENTTLGIEVALFMIQWPAVEVRRVIDPAVAAKFKIDPANQPISLVNRQGEITAYSPEFANGESYAKKLEEELGKKNVTPRPVKVHKSVVTTAPKVDGQSELIDEVHRNKHFVYQADLEQAVRTVLHNEVSKVSEINGEKLLALQRFLAVLQRYNPLGASGHRLVAKLKDYVVQFNEQLTGKQFEEELKRLEEQMSPVYSSTHFVGCAGSSARYRGFSCSLWTLFHFMTVQAANNEEATDPLEVLQAMHGYIKNFFGCTECSEHFQTMASRRKIWSVPNKEEAVLWLWAAHNEVNQRLAGDATEDPEFPKKQFPTPNSCSECYRSPVSKSENLEIEWNKDAVLSFLKNIHNPQFVSRYGVQREELLHPSPEKMRQKRQISNVFTDIDMRMGMLLYAFCIVMMVLAFKLFAFKGYRKKPYGHDLLGKV